MELDIQKNNKGFSICDEKLFIYLSTFGVLQKDRFINLNLIEYTPYELTYLYNGMYDGDGTKKRNRYSTNSIKLRDDYIKLMTILGHRVRYSYDSNCWRIYKVYDGNFDIRNYIEQEYNDYVYYCLTVEDNHTVSIGMDGKFSWCGQCYGLLGNPIFHGIADNVCAGDVTAMARTSTKYMREIN